MPVYDAANVPDTVGRGTLDPELAAWLPSGPTLGADVPIAQGRRDHARLGMGPWPSIGAVDTLVLPGPHGSITVRRHTPSSPTSSPCGALDVASSSLTQRRRCSVKREPCRPSARCRPC